MKAKQYLVNKKQYGLILALAVIVCLAGGVGLNRVFAQGVVYGNLTGTWTADDGGIYYIRHAGNIVWWAGLNPDPYKQDVFHRGLLFANIFQGKISGDTIVGDWADTPRGGTRQNGTLTLRIVASSAPGGIELRRQSQTGGFGGSVWTKTAIVIPTCTNSNGDRVLATDIHYIYCLFDRVIKNQTHWYGPHESLLDNLKPYKDNVVVFGKVTESLSLNYQAGAGHSCSDFFNHGEGDGDINFSIQVNRADLDAQPNFWNEEWINDPNHIKGKLNFWGNRVHGEVIMYGRPDQSCNAGSRILLPGWGERGANSALWNGIPIDGFVLLGPNNSVTIGGASLPVDKDVRITGPLVLDCGHGITSPCHETENDPGDSDTKNLEMHPVYSIDIIQDFNQPRPNVDLTGVWVASDVGTYYVRQVGNAVWWLGLSRDRGRTFANVFHGTVQGSTITGEWADVPLGAPQNSGSLTLRGTFCANPFNIHLPCDSSKPIQTWNVLETQSTSNGIFGGYRWEKLYDRTRPTGPG